MYRYVRSATTLSVSALAMSALLMLAGLGNADAQTVQITRVLGAVSHRVGAQGQFAPSAPGVSIPVGSRIRTGPGGRCEVAFPGGNIIRAGERTDLVIESAGSTNVSRGVIYARIIAGAAMQIAGATATVAVRGTTLELQVLDDDSTVVSVATGAVDFFNDLGAVTVGALQQSTARPGEPPTRPIAVDPSSLQAWEATLQNQVIELEQPPQVGTDPALLREQLEQRSGAAEQRPDDAAAQADLSRVLLDLGRTEEALAAAQRATELAPEVAEYQGVLGWALLAAGQPDDAAQRFEPVAAAEPGNALWAVAQALAALATAADETALDLLRRAVDLAPDSALPPAYLAAAHMRLGDLEAASGAAARAVELAPDNHLALSYLAFVRLVQGNLDDALAAGTRATEMAPGSALAHDALGTALFFRGQFAQAREELDRALQINPVSARARLTLAKLLASEGELDEALDQGRAAIDLNPDSAPARSTYGLLLLLSNDPQAANEQFQAALELAPNLAEAHTGWGQVLARRGRFREALNQQKAALALDTDSAAVENNLGGLYAADGRMSLAVEHLQRAIELQPGWGLPYANLAFVHLELNEYARALEMARRAVELGERSPFVHTVLARIYARQGRIDQALSELRLALALDQDYPQARYQLAQLYVEQDRSRDAIREILAALTKDPSAMLETRRYARTEATLWGGSQETIHGEVRHSGVAADGDLTYFASGMVEESDGFRSANHDQSVQFAEAIAGHQSDPDTQLVLYATLLDSDAGLPGPRTDALAADPDDHRSFWGAEALVAWRQRVAPETTMTLKYTYRDRDFRFRNPDSLQGADGSPFRLLESEEIEQTPEIRVDLDLGDRTRASAGYARRCSDVVRFGAVGSVEPDRPRPRFEPFAQTTCTTTESAWVEAQSDVSDRLSVLIGGRWGDDDDGGSSVALPKLAVVWRPDPSSWLSLTADPIFRSDIAELASTEPLADPEGLRYLNFDQGGFARNYALRYQRGAVQDGTVTVSVARQDVEGLLVDAQDAAATGLPGRVLVGEGERWVVSGAIEQSLTDRVSGRAWVQWQATDGDFPDLQLAGMEWPYAPEWQAGARVDYIDESGWRVGLEGFWVGDRWHDPENVTRVPSYFVTNLRVQYQRNLHENYFLSIHNLADESYQTYLGFPQAGLSAFAGIEYRH